MNWGDFFSGLSGASNTIIADLSKAGVFGQQGQIAYFTPAQQQALVQARTGVVPTNWVALAIVGGIFIIGAVVIAKL